MKRRARPGPAREVGLTQRVEDAVIGLAAAYLEHPDNDTLRGALASGALDAAGLYRELLASALGLAVERILADRERASRSMSGKRPAGIPDILRPGPAGAFAGLCPTLERCTIALEALDRARAALGAGPDGLTPWGALPGEALGEAYEALLARTPGLDPGPPNAGAGPRFTLAGPTADGPNRRHASGSYYTPAPLVAALLDAALEPVIAATLEANPTDPTRALLALRILDPACGSGNFLLAAARRLAAHVDRVKRQDRHLPARDEGPGSLREVVQRCVYGIDVDAIAVALCRVALWLETGESGAGDGSVTAHIVTDDALLGQSLPAFSAAGAGGFDVVVGNPPFLNQLESRTAVGDRARRALNERFGGLKQAYTDVATLFLIAGVEALRPGGRLALVQPISLLATKDAAPARRHLAHANTLTSLWVTTERIFPGADVLVCAPCLQKGGPRRTYLARHHGNAFVPAPPVDLDMDALAADPTWGPLIVDLLGVPVVHLAATGCLADLAGTTADFRDQFYGLAPHVVEEGPGMNDSTHPRLIVTGLVDPAVSRWGERPCKFARVTWQRPRVDLRSLRAGGLLAGWAQGRLTPKLVLATQTSVLEAFADPTGVVLNTVPTITVTPRDAGDLWRLLAVLLAPPVSAWALGRYAGTALAITAIKLSAAQVAEIPLPTVERPWAAAAGDVEAASTIGDPVARRARLLAAGAAMCDAYGVPREPVLGWWAGGLPR